MINQVNQSNLSVPTSQVNQGQNIELYPGNWLYNAGVVGFLNVLCAYDKKYKSNLVNDILEKNEISYYNFDKLFNTKIDIQFTPHINEKVPFWHWEYLFQTYLKYYGNIENIVVSTFNMAKNTKYPKKQLLEKLINKKGNNYTGHNFTINKKDIDLSDVYKNVDNYWKDTFVNKQKITLEQGINKTINELKKYENAIIYRKAVGILFSINCPYQNYYNQSYYKDMDNFIKYFTINKILQKKQSSNLNNTENCDFCNTSYFNVSNIDLKMFSILLPNFKNYPNSFWSNKLSYTQKICSLCEFLILHQHLAFTNLSDNTKIFINAPSFELMYELNKLIKELSKIDYKSTKELLAMSVIEYSLKINAILGNWLLMNIEIVAIDKKNNIEFINIPYNVLRIISNKKIAALLSDIGEFKILNIVLNEKYSELVEIAYRIMRIALKSKRNESDNKFLQDTIFLDKNKGSNYNLLWFSNKILNLYALIKETIKIK